MARYRVTMTRVSYQSKQVLVEAESEAEAEDKAIKDRRSGKDDVNEYEEEECEYGIGDVSLDEE